MTETTTLTTPTMTLPFRAHLVKGDESRAEKWAKNITLPDGRQVNINDKYRITGDMDGNTEEVQEFVRQLKELQKEHHDPNTGLLPLPLKNGTVRAEDGTFVEAEDVVRLEFNRSTYKGKIPVLENGVRVGSIKEVLPRGTKFTVEFEVKPSAFTNDSGQRLSGITLSILSITVLHRPEVKSTFFKKKKA